MKIRKSISNEEENEELTNDEIDDFIDDQEQPEENLSFYWDLCNRDNYYKFPNQTRDPRDAIFEDDEMYFGVSWLSTRNVCSSG